MEKSIEEIIFETREVIKQVIVESKLSPMIIEMIIKDIYLDIKDLSAQLLTQNIAKRNMSEQKEEVKDG